MKVVLGITDKEVEAIEYISNFIHLLYDDEDFEGELSDQDCEKFDRWFDMMDAIDKIKFVVMNQIEMDKSITEKAQNIEQLSFGEMRKLMKRWIIHHAKYDVELSPGMLDRLLEECKRTYWRQS